VSNAFHEQQHVVGAAGRYLLLFMLALCDPCKCLTSAWSVRLLLQQQQLALWGSHACMKAMSRGLYRGLHAHLVALLL
jgi:hypothetical protein